MTRLLIAVETWPLQHPLRDSSGVLTDLEIVVVSLRREGRAGYGEAAGVYYRNENAHSMVEQIESVRAAIEAEAGREALLTLLPAGGARNALDCALWDLEAKLAGRAVWQLAGFAPPRPLLTTYTLSAEAPDEMAARALSFAAARAFKLKLTGEALDAERVRSVRAARPDTWLAVDANQGFSRPFMESLLPTLLDARVTLIEQPFTVGRDAELDGLRSPIPVAADESAQDIGDLPGLVGHYDLVNIKLDKCGGLTAALAMAREARRLGLDLMVGNMTGTTLAMAPAFVLGQLCQVVDLDGPLFLRDDRADRATYEGGMIRCPDSAWGGTAGT